MSFFVLPLLVLTFSPLVDIVESSQVKTNIEMGSSVTMARMPFIGLSNARPRVYKFSAHWWESRVCGLGCPKWSVVLLLSTQLGGDAFSNWFTTYDLANED
jgi:hypothetical protein